MRSADHDHIGPGVDRGVRKVAEVRHRARGVAVSFVRVDREHRDIGLLPPLAHRTHRRGHILVHGLVCDGDLGAFGESGAEQAEAFLAQHPFARRVAHPVVDRPQRRMRLGWHGDARSEADRVHAGARRQPRERVERRRDVHRRGGRRRAHQGDPPAGRLEEPRRPGAGEILAGAGVHDAGHIEQAPGRTHARRATIHRVVVRTPHEAESERPQILDRVRLAGDRPILVHAPDPCVGVVTLGDRDLEVAEGRVGTPQEPHDGGEPVVGLDQGRQPPRMDEVARQRQTKSSTVGRSARHRGRA